MKAPRAVRPFLLLASLVLALLAPPPARGEIPAAAKADPRYALGYLVVTHYPGVKNDGTGDSTGGIQRAIEDGYEHRLAVLFPGGT